MPKNFEYKFHLFVDCTAFPYGEPTEERQKRVVDDVRKITCGQCKGRIIQPLRDKSWTQLDADELALIQRWVNVAAVRS